MEEFLRRAPECPDAEGLEGTAPPASAYESQSGGIVDIIHDDLKNAATELPEDLITAQVNHLAGRKLQDFIDTSDVKKVVHDITKSTADSVMGVGSDRISAAAAGASYSSPSTVVEEQLEAGKQRYAAAQIAGRK